MRRIFVGDIQGCLEQLEHLLEKVKFRPRDVLYPVGDLVRKGPDSEGVLRLLMDLDAQPVLGNHDVRWLEKGHFESRKTSQWLASQPVVRVMSDVIMVHGGLHPKWKESHLENLSPAEVQFALTVRYCDEHGNQPEQDWPPPSAPYRPWHKFYSGKKLVVFGHWARQGLFRNKRVLGLDSGCCYGNALTAWIAEDDRIVQVPGWDPPH